MTVEFTDCNLVDTHTCDFDWDDGSSDLGVAATTNGVDSCSATHTYSDPGVYSVSVTVEDNHGETDSAVFEFVVVFDPDAGFVTGGGFIESPAGAYVPDATLTGKATFGFLAKYKKGRQTPDGQTVFQFKTGDLSFDSTAYQFLVVAGYKAQFKGDGTINGTGDYGFLLTAYDGDIKPSGPEPDKFRIKIWDKTSGDMVVYDNKIGVSDDIDAADPQQIGGGAIVIQTKGKK